MLRAVLAHILHDAGHQMARIERGHAEADGFFEGFLQLLDGAQHHIPLGQQLMALFVDDAAYGCGRHDMAGAGKQGLAQLGFNFMQLLGKRRLRNKQAAGGLRDILMLAYGDNVGNVLKVHISILLAIRKTYD